MPPKGLSALIPENPIAKQVMQKIATRNEALSGDLAAEARDRIVQIPIAKLIPNARQPRVFFDPQQMKDLAESIRIHGIIQPLIVAPMDDGRYEIVAGERRYRAAKEIGMRTVPALLRKTKELERLELALIENIQRADLNPIETAAAYRKLLDEFGLTHDEAAHRVAKPRSMISNALRLLELPSEIQRAIGRGEISEGHGKILAGLQTEGEQLTAYRKVIAGDLTVRETELVTKQQTPSRGGRRRSTVTSDSDREAERLQDHLATRVEIRRRGASGSISIKFSSEEELRRIVRKILK